MTLRIGDIVQSLGGELLGDPDRVVARLAPLEAATTDELSYLANPRLAHLLDNSHAGCVIVGTKLAEAAQRRGDCIVVDNAHLYFARVTQLWRRLHGGLPRPGVHPSAVVEEGAVIDPSASVGALCYIGRHVRIGADTVLHPRVTVADGCVIGARCILQSGSVIGDGGFGFAPDNGTWVKIEQFGAVRIGDDVEIGANTCVDRGALGDTVIEDGVKLDNQIQIGHNCHIGKHTAMAGCVGVAGSATIGAHCTVGGGAIVLGHLALADHVHISAATVVTRTISEPGHYTGMFPIDDNARWEKNAATLKQLHSLRERIKALERALNAA